MCYLGVVPIKSVNKETFQFKLKGSSKCGLLPKVVVGGAPTKNSINKNENPIHEYGMMLNKEKNDFLSRA